GGAAGGVALIAEPGALVGPVQPDARSAPRHDGAAGSGRRRGDGRGQGDGGHRYSLLGRWRREPEGGWRREGGDGSMVLRVPVTHLTSWSALAHANALAGDGVGHRTEGRGVHGDGQVHAGDVGDVE